MSFLLILIIYGLLSSVFATMLIVFHGEIENFAKKLNRPGLILLFIALLPIHASKFLSDFLAFLFFKRGNNGN